MQGSSTSNSTPDEDAVLAVFQLVDTQQAAVERQGSISMLPLIARSANVDIDASFANVGIDARFANVNVQCF